MHQIIKRLEKFWSGKSDTAEKLSLLHWIKKNKVNWMLSLFREYHDTLHDRSAPGTDERAERILQQLHRRIYSKSHEASNTAPIQRPIRHLPKRRYLKPFIAAASILVLLTIGGLVFHMQRSSPDSTSGVANPLITKINLTNTIMPVALADGSSVLLQPGSKISFPTHFRKDQREVTFSGVGFFEIEKDAQRPFTVITSEMVTRVLGTSFTVSAPEHQPSSSVTVRTGKVWVLSKRQYAAGLSKQSMRDLDTVKLIANQQAVLDHTNDTFLVNKGNKASLGNLLSSIPTSYTFSETPVKDIFTRISKDYAVRIEFDEKILSGCALTMTLTDETFFEKLRVICAGIGKGTIFQVGQDKITIISNGCN